MLAAPAALIALPPAMLAAEQVTGAPGIYQIITGLGFPTALVIAWMRGWVVSGREHDSAVAACERQIVELRQDRDEERAERIRLQTVMTERTLPALTRQTLVMEAALPLLENEVRLRAARERLDDGTGGG